MRPASGRAALAEAIARRNAAAKAVEVARENFEAVAGPETDSYGEGRMGEKHVELRRARYSAEDSIAQVEARQNELLTTYMGDRVKMHTIIMQENDGKSGDELLDAARRDLDAAQKAEAALAAAKGKLDLLLTDAERSLTAATANVEREVGALLEGEAAGIATTLADDMHALLQKLGAVDYLLKGSNKRQCQGAHPLKQAHDLLGWLSTIGQNSVTQERRILEAVHREGMLPWIAAASRLAVDANAALPTDPKVKAAA